MYRAQLFHPDPFAQDLVMLPRRYLPDIQGLLLDEPLDWFPKASETTWGLQQTLTFFGTAESSGKGALLANPHYVACYVMALHTYAEVLEGWVALPKPHVVTRKKLFVILGSQEAPPGSWLVEFAMRAIRNAAASHLRVASSDCTRSRSSARSA